MPAFFFKSRVYIAHFAMSNLDINTNTALHFTIKDRSLSKHKTCRLCHQQTSQTIRHLPLHQHHTTSYRNSHNHRKLPINESMIFVQRAEKTILIPGLVPPYRST
jgi:hypothetical protein